jgi:hypothetical protein
MMGVNLTIMSYRVLPFLWYVAVAQLAGRTDSITGCVWVGSKSRTGDCSSLQLNKGKN